MSKDNRRSSETWLFNYPALWGTPSESVLGAVYKDEDDEEEEDKEEEDADEEEEGTLVEDDGESSTHFSPERTLDTLDQVGKSNREEEDEEGEEGRVPQVSKCALASGGTLDAWAVNEDSYEKSRPLMGFTAALYQ